MKWKPPRCHRFQCVDDVQSVGRFRFYASLRFFYILRRLRFPTNEGKTVTGLQFH